jgi:hypothetical protein
MHKLTSGLSISGGKVVGKLRITSGQSAELYAESNVPTKPVYKATFLYSVLAPPCRVIIHYFFRLFTSVSWNFIPTFHSPYNKPDLKISYFFTI